MKTFRWLIKAFVAGCIAFALLCGFSFFWYNVPVHYDNPTGATEYIWESHKFYSKATEGFALGRTNNEGFNNLKDYVEGDSIDILLMGSSHMEGFNVAQDKNAGAVLNQLFQGEKYCYNIGTAGHNMLYCIDNLSAALDRYQPEEYVVIETFSVNFSEEELASVVDGSIAHIPSRTGGFVGLMQKLPYLRLFYTQHFKGGDAAFGDMDSSQGVQPENESMNYDQALSPVMEIISRECSSHGVTPILVFNASMVISEDGKVDTNTNTEQLAAFQRVCEEKGILLLDISDACLEHHASCYELPYGFSNTSPGGGHMNKIGHRIFAEEVFKAIREMEG